MVVAHVARAFVMSDTKMHLLTMLFPSLLTCLNATQAPAYLPDPRTLRASGLPPLLQAYHAQALDSGKVSHALPGAPGDTFHGLSLLRRGDTSLMVSPRAGIEWRNPDGELIRAIDVGGRLEGATEKMSFWVQAAMVSAQSSKTGRSWDGQYQEFQKDGTNSNLTYTSYSRYEGMLTAQTGLGRISFGRSRVQWGPSVAYPLVLGSYTSPYPLFDWALEWGDFRVRTLWGSLSIDGAGSFRHTTATRSVYGHRYEWLPTNWLSLGMSEALYLKDREEPAGLFPLAPLFMEKGQGIEDDNNGELAFDLELRPFRGTRLYGEFLIDDVSEPTSLFNDLWKNRWAFTLGMHQAAKWHGNDLGALLEYSHVEPWVYAHYAADGPQAATQGFLMGNPNGPNSRSIKLQGYGAKGSFHLESSLEWVWKGTDLGSRWTDTLSDNETTTKTFLAGGGKLGCRGEVHLGWSYGYATIWLDLAKQFATVDLQRVQPNAPVAMRLQGGW